MTFMNEDNMEDLILFDSEYKMMEIVWSNEPVRSGDLVKLCSEKLDWKKSTTYTVLKKLGEKGVLKNEDSIVTSLIGKEQVQELQSEQMVKKSFGGSLPAFVSAFLKNGSITKEEANKLIDLIENHIED